MWTSLKQRWAASGPYARVLVLWLAIALIVLMGIELGLDERVIGVIVAVFGVATHAFSSLLALIALVPMLGPIMVKVLTLPFFWILNGLGYFISIIAIRRGYSKEVVNYRMLTYIFLLGVVFGYVLGKIV